MSSGLRESGYGLGGLLTSSFRFDTSSTVARGSGGAARARRAGDAGVSVSAPKAGSPTPPTPTPYGDASPDPRPRNGGANTPPPRIFLNVFFSSYFIIVFITERESSRDLVDKNVKCFA